MEFLFSRAIIQLLHNQLTSKHKKFKKSKTKTEIEIIPITVHALPKKNHKIGNLEDHPNKKIYMKIKKWRKHSLNNGLEVTSHLIY
jgi:hypothetical protein